MEVCPHETEARLWEVIFARTERFHAGCWHWETNVGQNPEHPTLCGRCVEAVKQFKA
jgi:isoleucyl-tRNA synthetase